MVQDDMQIHNIMVGEEVLVTEKKMTGETREIAAKVVEIRTILGKQTYVIETEHGKRKVVGESQILKV
jgi:hypothetical protein